jgi:hypothetical protein
MKLYHSSNVIVQCPDTKHSRKYLDFGCGFTLPHCMTRRIDMLNASSEEGSRLGSIHTS